MRLYHKSTFQWMFRQAMQCFEEVPRRTVPHLQCIVEEKDRLKHKKIVAPVSTVNDDIIGRTAEVWTKCCRYYSAWQYNSRRWRMGTEYQCACI
jgi:hypothetical protein